MKQTCDTGRAKSNPLKLLAVFYQVVETDNKLRLGKFCLNAYLHLIAKHSNGLCDSYNKPETVTHFLPECPHSEACSAELAACNICVSSTIDLMLSA